MNYLTWIRLLRNFWNVKERCSESQKWLESVGAKAVEAVSVTIGDKTWEGARYWHLGYEKFYLVGMLPKDWESTKLGSITHLATIGSCTFATLRTLPKRRRVNGRR